MVYNSSKMCTGGHANAPLSYNKMISISTTVLIIKYIAATSIFVGIVCAPAWIARQSDKGKQDMFIVRTGSWLFGWSIIGWFYALFIGAKK